MEATPAPEGRHITTPVSREMLAPLTTERFVQFPHPLTDREYRKVAKLTAGRPDVLVRAYGIGFTDLEFLRFFPDLRRFQADTLYRAESLDGLRHLPDDVVVLALGEAKTKRQLDLSVLRRFTALKELYLEQHTKGIEVLRELTQLEDLTLRSITLPDLDLLVPLSKLQSLDIKLGGTSDLGLLPQVGRLRYLELWRIRGLEDISMVSELADLQHLFLQSLGRVDRLPDLSRLTKLRRVTLDSMKGIGDLGPLADAPALEEILLVAMTHIRLDDLDCLVGHPTLREAVFGLGSVKRNAAAYEMVGVSHISGPFVFR